MTKLTVEHADFTIERHFDFTPEQVYAAWADPAAKAVWFRGPDTWEETMRELDFRPGGEETLAGVFGGRGGTETLFESRYHDILPNRRIVYSYVMTVGGKRISISLATAEFITQDAGTRFVYTEQGAFLDGLDNVDSREHGTRAHFDRLAAMLSGR